MKRNGNPRFVKHKQLRSSGAPLLGLAKSILFYHFCFCCSPLQNVRRVALVTFNSAAHNKPSLIRDLLEQILPQLYNETKVRVC